MIGYGDERARFHTLPEADHAEGIRNSLAGEAVEC